VKIFITGIGGFLGSRLDRFWKAAGHTVAGATRHDSGPSLSGFDVVVHAAYDRQGSVESNVATVKTVCAVAAHARVPYQIFISSYAARRESAAVYGRMKYQLETFFLQHGLALVRPGLVIGKGGMFGHNLKMMLRSPVIPLLDGGRDLIPIIAIEDLVEAIDVLVVNGRIGAFNLFNRDLVPMRTMVETINQVAGRKPLLVPIPVKPALILLALAEKLHIPFPANTDNVRSLKQSLPYVYQSDLEALIPSPRTLKKMIEAAIR
jgi:nucleoside-diphosphate-sugar epimerase